MKTDLLNIKYHEERIRLGDGRRFRNVFLNVVRKDEDEYDTDEEEETH